MNKTLTKQEIDFLLNILLPNSLDDLHEGEHKSKIKLLLDIHNPKLIASIDSQLLIKNVSLEEYYEQAFKNTVGLFFAQKKQNGQKKYFSIVSVYDLKNDFVKLLKFNTFYNIGQRIFAVQFYLFLDHLYQTFETLESYDNSSRLSRGTAFLTSNYRAGLDSTYKQLQDEYNPNRDFPIEAIDTREKIKVNLFSVKTFRNHRSVANLMIICNAMHNFNNLKVDLTEGQAMGFKQSFSILNGLKTSKEEVIRSFMIKTYFPYYRKEKINKTLLADITHKIAETFFPDIVYPRKGTGQYTIGLSARVFNYKLYIKTALLDNLIYAYDHKNEYTYLIKGTIDDACRLMKKVYIDSGHDEIVNNPLFDRTIKKLLANPIYPI